MATGIVISGIVSDVLDDGGNSRFKVLNNTPNTLFKGRVAHIDEDSVIYATRDPLAPLEAEGIIVANIDPYKWGYVQREGGVKLTDWTILTGSQFLTQGAKYYLGTDGLMTELPPNTEGLSQEIGVAIDNYTLDIEIQPSIMLT